MEFMRTLVQQKTFCSVYAIVYPVSNPTAVILAVNTVMVFIDIMTSHVCVPTLNIRDKGSIFVSQVTNQVEEILGLNLKNTTTNHAQTIGFLERPHSTNRTSSKMASGKQKTMAQLFAYSNPNLQHNLPFQHWLLTKPSVLRQDSAKLPK